MIDSLAAQTRGDKSEASGGGMPARSIAALVRAAQAAAGVPAYFPVRLAALPEAAAWVSGGRLTPGAVAAARNGSTMTIKRSPDPLFMYSEVGVPDRLPDGATGVGARTEFVDMLPAAFVQACERQDGTTPPFHYYTSGIAQHAPGFAQECPGWQRLVVDEEAAAERLATPTHSSLWVGGHGSTTQAHYDVLHNVFVQVHGTKRFRLWGPDAHSALRVFPDAHPRARKAQVTIDADPDLPAPELDLVLEPGDAVFVPAFWFHHVEAQSLSVSVNVFSDSRLKQAAQDVLCQPLPRALSAGAGAGARRRSHHSLLRTARQLCVLINTPVTAPRPFNHALVAAVSARYAPMPAGEAASPAVAAGPAHAFVGGDGAVGVADEETVSQTINSADVSDRQTRQACETDTWVGVEDEETRAVVKRVSAGLAKVRAAAGECADSRHVRGLQEVVAGHLLESWAVHSVGAYDAGPLLDSTAAILTQPPLS